MRSDSVPVRKKDSGATARDDAITSVVGEMLLLVLVVILVSIMSASAFNLLPGERETVIDVSMSTDASGICFWHHGGDWADKRDLSVYIMKSDGTGTTASITSDDGLLIYAYNSSSGDYTVPSNVFDLGCEIEIKKEDLPSSVVPGEYDLRLIYSDKVIAAYDEVTLT